MIDKPTYALVIAQRRSDRRSTSSSSSATRWACGAGSFRRAPRRPERARAAELAARELREETGLRADTMTPLGQLDVAPGMSSQRGWVFLATGITEGEHDREHEEQDMHSAVVLPRARWSR